MNMDWNALAERAVEEKHSRGLNCCQAVVLALKEETDLPEELLLRLAAGMAGGQGTREGTCGALVGAGIIAGLKTGGKGTMPKSRAITERFRALSGAVVCKDLKGAETGVVLCSCDDCVRNGVLAYAAVLGE